MKTALKLILIMGVLNLFACAQKSEVKNDDLPQLESMSDIYPYIITKDYLLDNVTDKILIIDTIIENQLYLTLVKDFDGLVRIVQNEDLQKENISKQRAKQIALDNLDLIFKQEKVKVAQFNGPRNTPFILFSDHWLSAASLYWRNLYSFSKRNLNKDTFYISIPQRDAMLVFPKCNQATLNEFRDLIKENEFDARKPLTWELFMMDENGIKKID